MTQVFRVRQEASVQLRYFPAFFHRAEDCVTRFLLALAAISGLALSGCSQELGSVPSGSTFTRQAAQPSAIRPHYQHVFSYTGTVQLFTVPTGVSQITIAAAGAAGGGARHLVPSGSGALVKGTFPVQPGETLYVEVALHGGSAGGSGHYGPGGRGGAYTAVAVLRSDGSVRLLVVAGGGGGAGAGGDSSAPGGGGGNAGHDGSGGGCGAAHCCDACPGGGGAQSGGGRGGTSDNGGGGGVSGAHGAGGDGGPGSIFGGGGGGGGYFGGGGGAGSGNLSGGAFGGGGGSSHVELGASNVTFGINHYRTGEVTISW